MKNKNKKVKYNFIPEYDFHFLSPPIFVYRISDELENIIDIEKHNYNRVIRIIVGRGKNSPFGPVIKPIVKNELINFKNNGLIKRFELEHTKSGYINEGAFIVELY